MRHELYLLVESGPIMDLCRNWKERYVTARTAAFTLAKSIGSIGFFDDWDGNISALVPTDIIPEGWHVTRPKSQRDRRRMVPVKGEAGDAARTAIAALPQAPKHREIAAALGHPCYIRYTAENGHGRSSMSYRVHPVQLFWPDGDGAPFLILAPDADAAVAAARKENPGCTIEVGEWTVPDGVRVISQARKDLIMAEWAVKAEEAA